MTRRRRKRWSNHQQQVSIRIFLFVPTSRPTFHSHFDMSYVYHFLTSHALSFHYPTIIYSHITITSLTVRYILTISLHCLPTWYTPKSKGTTSTILPLTLNMIYPIIDTSYHLANKHLITLPIFIIITYSYTFKRLYSYSFTWYTPKSKETTTTIPGLKLAPMPTLSVPAFVPMPMPTLNAPRYVLDPPFCD